MDKIDEVLIKHKTDKIYNALEMRDMLDKLELELNYETQSSDYLQRDKIFTTLEHLKNYRNLIEEGLMDKGVLKELVTSIREFYKLI